MSLEQMQHTIDISAEAFPGICAVVFSGGECFLLRDDLRAAISHAKGRGLGSRCVTNGYWATSPRGVTRHLGPLLEAGLSELNLSTGDAHQAYVPWKNVLRAAIASAEAGLTTLIAVETNASSRFTAATVHQDPQFEEFMSKGSARERLSVVNTKWVDFADQRSVCDGATHNRVGCDNLFDNIVFTPEGSLLACCGLTAHEIPEMTLGQSVRSAQDLRTIYYSQLEDFSKVWLWLDGPLQICADLATVSGLPPPSETSHPCAACKVLFRSEKYRHALQQHYAARIPDVLFRSSLHTRLTQPIPIPIGVPRQT